MVNRNCLLAVVVLCAGGTLRAQYAAPSITRQVGIDQKLNSQLPLTLPFRNESGEAVTLTQYFGRRPVIMALVYYKCPNLCNLTLDGLAKALRHVSFVPGSDYDVVVVSFDPTETPELAAAKKENYAKASNNASGFNQGWHFLTGQEPAIKRLTQAAGFRYRWDEQTKQFVHATGISVATPAGVLSKYFYGVEYPATNLRLALVEASHNKIGTPVDQFLLYCFHYDPVQGKYSLVILNVLKLLGGITALGLGGFVGLMFIKERRAARLAERTFPHA